MLLMRVCHRLRQSWTMNLTEQNAFKKLQQCASKSDAQRQLSGWVVKSGRSGGCIMIALSLSKILGLYDIPDMYDICAYAQVNKASLTLTHEFQNMNFKTPCCRDQQSCAVNSCWLHVQVLLRNYCIDPATHQGTDCRCMYTLLQELKDTGAQTPAVGMLVEPLLPRALRKELDKQKTLKGEVDTDLYAIGIGEQHLAHSCSEEGL